MYELKEDWWNVKSTEETEDSDEETCMCCIVSMDYTNTCQHHAGISEADLNELKSISEVMKKKDMESKRTGLKNITKSLDLISSHRDTSVCILQGSFTDIVNPYLIGTFDQLFKESGWSCEHCVGSVTPIHHALIMIARGFT
jgi:hypothetical protein